MGKLFKWNKCRILTADDFLYIHEKFGAEVAKNVLRRVQEGRLSLRLGKDSALIILING